MKRRLLVLAPLALAGCASILPKQKYIPRVSWPLDPAPPVGGGGSGSKVVLLRDLTAGPGMDDQAIQTLNADGSLTTSYYNQWAVAPASAATQALGNWLTASGDFSAVVAPGSRLAPDLVVEGELTELVSDAPHGQARAVLTLVVIADVKGNTRPLAQQRITGTAALRDDGYAAQAAGQSAALADALRQAVGLLGRFAG